MFQADDAQARAYAHPRTHLLFPGFAANGNGHFEELLAKAIPARTFAIGANKIPNKEEQCTNMPDRMKNEWPLKERNSDLAWLHSDFKDVAFVYTYKVYEEVVKKGGLQ